MPPPYSCADMHNFNWFGAFSRPDELVVSEYCKRCLAYFVNCYRIDKAI